MERGKQKSEVSVMDMERRGWHTQATVIIQLLNKEEDMMKEAYAQSIECEEPCEGETFTHGSVRGWGWNSLALLDPVPFKWNKINYILETKITVIFLHKWNVYIIFASSINNDATLVNI